MVNDWGKAPVYFPSEIIKEKFEIVPFHRTTECIHGAGHEIVVWKGPLRKGQIVYTVYNRIPGILKCEIYAIELGKVALTIKKVLCTEKSPEEEDKFDGYIENLLFTADKKNVFTDLDSLFSRIQEENTN